MEKDVLKRIRNANDFSLSYKYREKSNIHYDKDVMKAIESLEEKQEKEFTQMFQLSMIERFKPLLGCKFTYQRSYKKFDDSWGKASTFGAFQEFFQSQQYLMFRMTNDEGYSTCFTITIRDIIMNQVGRDFFTVLRSFSKQ